VLAAVDCLDALSSHRQYRNAMSLDAAMEKVASISGTEFEPRVVEVLKRRYRGSGSHDAIGYGVRMTAAIGDEAAHRWT
jgi:HD-GYP domain-containing protein (c-di-GMP phosphodiesterase class II)